MHEEIASATELVCRLIIPGKSDTVVTQRHTLALAVARRLEERYSGHWHPGNPLRGSGHRALQCAPGSPDPTLLKACRSAFPDRSLAELVSLFHTSFVVWCDPGEVAIQLGDACDPWTHWSAPQRSTSQNLISVESSSSDDDASSVESECAPLCHTSTLSVKAQAFEPRLSSSPRFAGGLVFYSSSRATTNDDSMQKKKSTSRRRRTRGRRTRPATTA
jgi:hypothetical protein